MFDIGIGEIAVLLFAALFVFGPDRLPTVAAQAARMLRQLRQLAAGAREQLTDAIGPDLADLNVMKDLTELNQLRRLDPRSIITSALLDDPEQAAAPLAATNGSTPTIAGPVSAHNDPADFDPDAT